MTIVLGLIICAFAFWGIGDIFRGFGTNKIASVGGAPIAPEEFRSAYQAILQRYQRQTKSGLTSAQAHAIGLDVQMLKRLIADKALDVQAKSLGLAISDETIAAGGAQRSPAQGRLRRVQPRPLRPGRCATPASASAASSPNSATSLSAPADRRRAGRRARRAEAAASTRSHGVEAQTRGRSTISCCPLRRRARSPRRRDEALQSLLRRRARRAIGRRNIARSTCSLVSPADASPSRARSADADAQARSMTR